MEFLSKIKKAVDRKIKRIQRSNSQTKRKWLIAGSIVAMVLVIFFWVIYLNISVPEVVSDNNNQPAQEDISFIQSVSKGAKILYTKIEKGVQVFIEETKIIFSKKREFEFSN